jgi:hypothetical protein
MIDTFQFCMLSRLVREGHDSLFGGCRIEIASVHFKVAQLKVGFDHWLQKGEIWI